MKKNAGLSVLLAAALLLVSVSCKRSVYTSQRWRVRVHSAGYQKDFRYQSVSGYPDYKPVERKLDGLVVHVTLGYVGPEGLSSVPEISLLRQKDRAKIEPTLIQSFTDPEFSRLGEKIGKSPKTGKEIVAEMHYVYPVAKTDETYLFVVGDMEPIPVRP